MDRGDVQNGSDMHERMTLRQLSGCYRAAAEPLRQRLRQLRQELKTAEDPEEIFHLKRRIAELTPKQRETILAYYFQDMTIEQIAQKRGVNKSTVCRCLKRAEDRVRRCLRY